MNNIVSLFSNESQSKIEPQPDARAMNVEAQTFLEQIIRPAIKVTDLWSPSAEVLLLGTALAESGLRTVKQYDSGPAISFFQIEPNTYKDVVAYINRKKEIKEKLLSSLYMDIFPYHECLTWNMRLSVIIARMLYWRVPSPLPRPNDIEGMARYWKKYYNTSKGKGTQEHFIEQWRAHQHGFTRD